jgi:hypothetical protein
VLKPRWHTGQTWCFFAFDAESALLFRLAGGGVGVAETAAGDDMQK